MYLINHLTIIIALIIIAPSHSHAMEIRPAKKPKLNHYSFNFADLPDNVLNCILHYLTYATMDSEEEYIADSQEPYIPTPKREYITDHSEEFMSESKEEFIARTKTPQKPIPNKYYSPEDETLLKKTLKYPSWSSEKGKYHLKMPRKPFLSAYSPDEINIALIDPSSHILKIFNIKKDQLLHTQELETETYRTHLALSNNAIMFAVMCEYSQEDTRPVYEEINPPIISNYIMVQNIVLQKTETFNIPDIMGIDYKRDSIPLAFNKDGTHIILHGKDYRPSSDLLEKCIKKEPQDYHLIFPLTIAPKILLQDYFQKKGICKKVARTINK